MRGLCVELWSHHQSIFSLKMKWQIGRQKQEMVYNTRVQVRGLITSREDISTLQHPFQERLPANPMLFEYLIMLVLYFFIKKKYFYFLLF